MTGGLISGKKITLVLDLCIDVIYHVPQSPRGYTFLLLSNHHRDLVQQIHGLGWICDPRRRTR
jgi:hypothetical protein